MKATKKSWQLWLSLIILIATVTLMVAYYNRLFSFAYFVGPFRAIHYIAFAGTLYIAISVPLIAFFKRRKPQKTSALIKIHVFMNLSAFLLISMHFAGQIGRPADFYPTLGTGLTLYIAMALQVFFGLTLRFSQLRFFSLAANRFLHIGLALVFYIVILVHILHGLNII